MAIIYWLLVLLFKKGKEPTFSKTLAKFFSAVLSGFQYLAALLRIHRVTCTEYTADMRRIQNFDALAITDVRRAALTIAEAGYEAIDTRSVLARKLRVEGN